MESKDLVSAPLTSVEEQPEMIFSTDTCNTTNVIMGSHSLPTGRILDISLGVW